MRGVILAVLWVWTHLLQFTVSNQIEGQEEDAVNKSYRPLPAGRITLRNTILLRWLLVPICWSLSGFINLRTLGASIALSILTAIHNELGFHGRFWVIRNILNGLGIASFELGATLVICK